MESASAPTHEDSGPDSRPQPFPEYFEPTVTSQPVSGPGPVSRIAHTTANANNDNGSVHPRADGANAGGGRARDASGVIPPYWSHHRNSSRASQASLEQLPPITLEDHTEDPNSETSRGLWARSVVVDDHAVVQGKTGVGAYVVWNCRIQTLDGGPIVLRMRYSEFDTLRQQLLLSFPHAKNALPALPPKSVLFRFRPAFLESRRVGLEYFLNCVLLNPEFAGSPIVKDFLFGRMS